MDLLATALNRSVAYAHSIAHSPGRRAAFLTLVLAAISASAPPASMGFAVAIFQTALWCVLAVSCMAVVKQANMPKGIRVGSYGAIVTVWAGVLMLEAIPQLT